MTSPNIFAAAFDWTMGDPVSVQRILGQLPDRLERAAKLMEGAGLHDSEINHHIQQMKEAA